MPRVSVWLLSGIALLAAVPAARADAPAWWDVSGHAPDARALTAKIDHHLAQGWRAAGVQPAPPASDAEFLRRVYLDLAGRVPSVAEVRRFRADKRADRRERLIAGLLDGPRYAAHFSHVWRALWLPESASSIQGLILTPGFENWLRKNLAANTPYDRLVRELLTVPLPSGQIQRVIEESFLGKPTPLGFYLVKEAKAENLAAGTSRLFLGIKLECAQCHNHPFNDWKREQFWSMAAFFSGVDGKVQDEFTIPAVEKPDSRSIKIPNTETVIQASFLNGAKPQFKKGVAARATLAEWVTAADNPYFARAAVNRVWAYFFGNGLTDPVDEMIGGESKQLNPALLDELSRQFVASGFDMKFLVRAIVSSRAYQLTTSGKAGGNEAGLFARMPVRGLTAEQLYDSVAQATGYNEPPSAFPISFVPGSKPSLRAEFMTRFASTSEKSTDFHTSILHALALMNGKLVGLATDLQKSETLGAVINAPFLDSGEQLEVLYLATLARQPRAEELSRLTRHLEGARNGQGAGTPTQRYNRAMGDVFWALLNSGEFLLNH